jgi:hypothetical protein
MDADAVMSMLRRIYARAERERNSRFFGYLEAR